MNRSRKIKHTLSKTEENSSPKNEPTATKTSLNTSTKHKLLTPCRRMGLNRKRKNISSPTPSELSTSSQSLLDISSPNDVIDKEPELFSSPSLIRRQTATSVEEPQPAVLKIKKNTKLGNKSSLGARRRPPTVTTVNTVKKDPISVEQLLKKYNICDVSVDLTRCDFDKYIINRTATTEDLSATQIEKEAICSTPELQKETNILQPVVENTPIIVEKKSENLTSKKIKDLFGDSDESDFDFKRKKRKRFSLISTKNNKSSQETNSNESSLDLDEAKNKTKEPTKKGKKTEDSPKKPKTKVNVVSQNDSDETSDIKSRKKRKRSTSRSKKSPKSKTPKRRPFASSNSNSDSDDDFMEKPRRDKKDPDFKKKINIPVPADPLNRIEHIRIRENKSYTIMHMNNISSYVKYYDNDVNLKRTESDDNQQTQPVVSKDKTVSMILERKDYLSNKESQEVNHNSEPINQVIETSEPVTQVIETSEPVTQVIETSEPVNPVIDTSEPVNPVIDTSEPVNPVIDTSDPVNPVIDTSDPVNPVIETSEPVNPVIDTSEPVNPVIETSEPVNPVVETSEPVNPVIETSEPVNAVIEASEPSNEVIETSEPANPVIENPEPPETSDSAENPNSNSIDSNDTENPDSNDTLPEKGVVRSFENPETVSDFIKRRFEKLESETSNNFRGFANPESRFNDFENRRFEQPKTVSRFDMSVFDEPNPIRYSDQPENVKYSDQPENVTELQKIKSNLLTQIKIKRDKLDSLKRIMLYKEEHNLDELRKTTLQFKYTLQEALVDLLSHLKTHTERNFNMLLLLGFLKIPSEMVGYNDETKSFE